MTKRGNVKIGISVSGMPTILSSINITKAYKENGSFVLDEDFDQNQKTIKFKLPYVNKNNFNLNFKLMNAAFIKIKNLKYMLLKEDDIVIAYPLDVKRKLNKKLPKINLGNFQDWSQKLSFNEKAILECLLVKKEIKDGEENTISGDSYLFKTSSSNSIIEIDEILSIISKLEPEIIRFLTLKLELHTKIYKKGTLSEITYARIQMPSTRDILLAKKMADTFGKENNEILNMIEDARAEKVREGDIISKEDFEKEFGLFTIEEDSDDENEFINLSGEQKEIIENIDTVEDINNIVENIQSKIKNKKISSNILKSMIKKFGKEKTIEIILEKENNEELVDNMALIQYMGNN